MIILQYVRKIFGRLYDALTPVERQSAQQSDAGRPAKHVSERDRDSLTLGSDIAFDDLEHHAHSNGVRHGPPGTTIGREIEAGRPTISVPEHRAGTDSPWSARASEVEPRTMPYETYLNLITQVDDLIEGFEQHPDDKVREQALALLEGVDALHREGLTRLVTALRNAGAGDLVAQATQDPVVEILLGLYDLVELDLPDDSDSTFVPVDRVAISPDARDDANDAPADD